MGESHEFLAMIVRNSFKVICEMWFQLNFEVENFHGIRIIHTRAILWNSVVRAMAQPSIEPLT